MAITIPEGGRKVALFLATQLALTVAAALVVDTKQFIFNGFDAMHDLTADLADGTVKEGTEEYTKRADEVWDVDSKEVYFNDPLSGRQWTEAAVYGLLLRGVYSGFRRTGILR